MTAPNISITICLVSLAIKGHLRSIESLAARPPSPCTIHHEQQRNKSLNGRMYVLSNQCWWLAGGRHYNIQSLWGPPSESVIYSVAGSPRSNLLRRQAECAVRRPLYIHIFQEPEHINNNSIIVISPCLTCLRL